jgi:hypothetical protein
MSQSVRLNHRTGLRKACQGSPYPLVARRLFWGAYWKEKSNCSIICFHGKGNDQTCKHKKGKTIRISTTLPRHLGTDSRCLLLAPRRSWTSRRRRCPAFRPTRDGPIHNGFCTMTNQNGRLCLVALGSLHLVSGNVAVVSNW